MSTVPLSEAKAKLARLLTEVDELGERDTAWPEAGDAEALLRR